MHLISTDKYLWWSSRFPSSQVSYYKFDFLFQHGTWRNQPVYSCIDRPSQVVIVGHSDFAMTDEVALSIRNHTHCKVIFAINNQSHFDWVHGLPLGLTNYTLESEMHPIFGDNRMIYTLIASLPSKHDSKWIYMNFSIYTAPSIRGPIRDKFINRTDTTFEESKMSIEGREHYLRQLARHRFSLCPEGNGVDTPRLWESLYVGTIPIVTRSNVHKHLYSLPLPICWINDWDEVTPEFLSQEWERLKGLIDIKSPYLSQDYWNQYIQEKGQLQSISTQENLGSPVTLIPSRRPKDGSPTRASAEMFTSPSKDIGGVVGETGYASQVATRGQPRFPTRPIRLFNLDLHISVIADFRHIVSELYGSQVEITNWSISGHNWVFGKESTKTKHITPDTWKQLDQTMIDLFVEEYRSELEQYDGFVVTHSPVFCMLYVRFNKPIILINSCRYEQPFCWNGNINMWTNLNRTLQDLQTRGLLIAVSNNKADQDYLRLGSNVKSHHIPSLCEYVGITHQPSVCQGVLMSNEHIGQGINGLVLKQHLGHQYSWDSLYKHSFFVHIPYEISTMTLFEQYSSGAPLILPTPRWLTELFQKGQLHFNGPYALRCPAELPGLIDPLGSYPSRWTWWLSRADYYDSDNFYGCYFADGWEQLREFVSHRDQFTDPLKPIRLLHLSKRRIRVFDTWHQLLSKTWSLMRIN